MAFQLEDASRAFGQVHHDRGDGIIVRMDSREAKIYGPRVLDLLQRAKKVLSEKYELTLTEPVTVEIFPQQSDFAIRTFVCLGCGVFSVSVLES